MFYQTQLSKIGAGGAIDTQGKRLRFCGNLPVSEGDWVWTDGTVIFGHVPIRDTPSMPMIEGGIPAAFADDKGYFNQTGKFAKYSIAVDETTPRWIVNGKRKYFHSDTRVFDAEISINDDGIEDGLFTAELDGINGGNAGIYFIKDNTILDDDAVVIKKDGKEISRVYLHDFTYAFDKFYEKCNEYPCDSVELKGHTQLLNFRLHSDGSWDAIIASFVYGTLNYTIWDYGLIPEYDAIWRRNGYSIAGVSPAEFGGYFPCFSDADEEGEALAARYNALIAETGCKWRVEDFVPLWDDTPPLQEWLDKPRNGYNYSSTVRNTSPVVRIDPPAHDSTPRPVYIHYLIHYSSNNCKNIIQEEIRAAYVKVYKDKITLIEHPYNSDNHYYSEGTTIISNGLGEIYAWKAPDAKDIEIVRTKEVLFLAESVSIKNIKPTWNYPLQDGFSVVMNPWRILSILNPDGQSIVSNIAQTAAQISARRIDLSAGFPNALLHLYLTNGESWSRVILRREGRADEEKIDLYSTAIWKFIIGGYYRDTTNISTCAPTARIQLALRYIGELNPSNYTISNFITLAKNSYKIPYILLPAVVNLKNGGYLIGIPQHGIYKVDKDDIAELISDKDELANLRLRYMPNLSKTRR